jgi:hypothetical protein
MQFYCTESKIPELQPLSRASRRVVVLRALRLLRADSWFFYWLPVILCAIGASVGSLVGGMSALLLHPNPPTAVGNRMGQSIVGSFCGTSIFAFSAGFIGLLIQRWKLRPYLRRVIEEQADADKQLRHDEPPPLN